MLTDVLKEIAEGPKEGRLCPSTGALKEAFRIVMRGEAKPTEIAALLMGLRCREERAEHLHAVVEVMLENATPFPFDDAKDFLFDTCGTGGDNHGTVNISTAAAIIAAAGGIPVVKHGNRAVSSKSGSADVLEALGMKIDAMPVIAAELLRDCNFTFLFAQAYHPAMRHAGPVRRELGLRTIFNLAGPLSNPARPTHQLVGVARPELIKPIAETLRLLGRRRALVVHGRNGEDEISTTSVTEGLHLTNSGQLEPFLLDPKDLGLSPAGMEQLTAPGPKESAEKITRVLQGERGPVADVINLNAAAVFYLAGRAHNMREGLDQARDVQQSGEAAKLLQRVVDASNSVIA